MAVYQTYQARTNHEDLTDILTEIGQEHTPLYSSVKKVTAKNTVHEWSTYTYDDATANAQVEGATFEYPALTSPARVSNYTQIFTKPFQVSMTQQAVDPAGMKDEYAQRVEWKLKEIGKDIEKALLQGTGNSGASGTARQLKGLLAFITTNVSSGYGTATGANRAVTTGEINALMQKCLEKGSTPNWLLTTYSVQSKISELATAQRRYIKSDDRTLIDDVAVYQSPFGRCAIEGDIEMPSGTIVVCDKSLLAVAQLRPVHKVDTAITADAKNGVLVGELTLECRAEAMMAKATGIGE